jgi:4-amino-4-deoxy-L-arabinose transferase-like glycosyltransferase
VTRSPAPPLPPDLLGARAASSRGALLFTLACLAAAFWDLGGRSLLHHDVSRFGSIAREMLRSGDWLVPVRDGEPYVNKPVLYTWFVAIASLVAGDVTPTSVRLPSALALVAMAHATASWGRFRTGSSATGRIAGFLVLTTYFVHELGRASRPDLLAAAFATAAAWRIDRACAGAGSTRDPWLAAAWLGLAMLSKGPAPLLLPAAVLLLPRAGTTLRERLARARVGLLVAGALVVPALWFVPAALAAGGGFAKGMLVDQVLPRITGRGNHEEAPWYYLVALPVASVPWSPVYVAAGAALVRRSVREALGVGLPAAAAGVTFLAFSLFPTKEVRYVAVVVPPIAVATAAFVPWLASRARGALRLERALRAGGAVALAGCVVAGVALLARPDLARAAGLPVVLAALVGLGAVLTPRGERSTLPLAGRIAGLAVCVAGLGLSAYWAVRARRTVSPRDVENAAVAEALDPALPTWIVGGSGADETRLTPEALFHGVREATFVRRAEDVPGPSRVPRLQVVLMDADLETLRRARGGEPREVLRHPGRHGGWLLVLRSEP